MFRQTRKLLKGLHIALLIISHLILIGIPTFKLIAQKGVFAQNMILAVSGLGLLIFNLVIETHGRKQAKKERKLAKKLKAFAKFVGNVAAFIVLMCTWWTNNDPALIVPLVISSVMIGFYLLSTLLSFILKLLVKDITEDAKSAFGNVKRILPWKKKSAPALDEPKRKGRQKLTRRASITPLSKKRKEEPTAPTEAVTTIEMSLGEDGNTALAVPKKKRGLPRLFKKSAPAVPAEEVSSEAPQSTEVSEQLAPSAAKKRPLPRFLRVIVGKKKTAHTDAQSQDTVPQDAPSEPLPDALESRELTEVVQKKKGLQLPFPWKKKKAKETEPEQETATSDK